MLLGLSVNRAAYGVHCSLYLSHGRWILDSVFKVVANVSLQNADA
jgi:hypothetical protein